MLGIKEPRLSELDISQPAYGPRMSFPLVLPFSACTVTEHQNRLALSKVRLVRQY